MEQKLNSDISKLQYAFYFNQSEKTMAFEIIRQKSAQKKFPTWNRLLWYVNMQPRDFWSQMKHAD